VSLLLSISEISVASTVDQRLSLASLLLPISELASLLQSISDLASLLLPISELASLLQSISELVSLYLCPVLCVVQFAAASLAGPRLSSLEVAVAMAASVRFAKPEMMRFLLMDSGSRVFAEVTW